MPPRRGCRPRRPSFAGASRDRPERSPSSLVQLVYLREAPPAPETGDGVLAGLDSVAAACAASACGRSAGASSGTSCALVVVVGGRCGFALRACAARGTSRGASRTCSRPLVDPSLVVGDTGFGVARLVSRMRGAVRFTDSVASFPTEQGITRSDQSAESESDHGTVTNRDIARRRPRRYGDVDVQPVCRTRLSRHLFVAGHLDGDVLRLRPTAPRPAPVAPLLSTADLGCHRAPARAESGSPRPVLQMETRPRPRGVMTTHRAAIAIVGAGPRGAGLLERIAAGVPELLPRVGSRRRSSTSTSSTPSRRAPAGSGGTRSRRCWR